MNVRKFSFGLLSLVLVACGGAPAVAPASRAPVAAPAAAEPAPAPTSTPTTPTATPTPTIVNAEDAARAFVEAIAKHDAEGAARASSEDFGRGQARVYAGVTAARIEGPAPLDAWPHIGALDPKASVFWATFTTNDHSERILLSVLPDAARAWAVFGLRDEAMRATSAKDADDREKESSAPREAKGKLLTKPVKGSVKVQLADSLPSLGDKVQLLRRVDPSIPFVGGSWLVIADTEVTGVAGRTVTLKILAEKSGVKINGRNVDHYTPGVPIVLRASSTRL